MDSEHEFLKKIHKILKHKNKSISITIIKCFIPTSCKTIHLFDKEKSSLIKPYDYKLSMWPIKQKFGTVFILSNNHIKFDIESYNIINMTNNKIDPTRSLSNHKIIFIVINNIILIFKYVMDQYQDNTICKYKIRNKYSTHSSCLSNEICLRCCEDLNNIDTIYYDFKTYRKVNETAYLAQYNHIQIIYYDNNYYVSKTNSLCIPYWFVILPTTFSCDKIEFVIPSE